MKTIILLTALFFLLIGMHAQTVTDYDGNVYNTVTIGTQKWTKENLKTTHYLSGIEIPSVQGSSAWLSLTNHAMCYYNNDSTTYSTIYGALYNWYAADNSDDICPVGYHVATDNDWSTLIAYVGSSPYADSMLCNGCPAGFDGLLGGILSGFSGTFANEGNFGYFWSSTEESTANAWSYGGFRISAPQMNNRDYNPKTAGLSVRCMNDTLFNSVNEIRPDEKIRFYPNPAGENVFIVSSEEQVLLIYNPIGILILKGHLNKGVNEINIASLSKGIYIIKVEGVNSIAQQKLIKE